jgi:hypothetical protein
MRAEMTTEFRGLRSEMSAEMTGGFAVLGARIDSLSTRVDHLDRDVQHLMNREFGDNRA